MNYIVGIPYGLSCFEFAPNKDGGDARSTYHGM